ncbi:ATP-binding protein [Azospirillum sp. B4]|uniref:ATP-binding protein n=1 Tax=Azospirillum sp. B4 TaxID=95605 RepID=UPI00034D5E75|nr:ATP-binding protein [Azospirillum sp. B4]
MSLVREQGARPRRQGLGRPPVPNPGGIMKRLLPRTLFGRSLLIITTPVILAQAIATFYFYDQHWERVTNNQAFGVAGEIAMVIEQLGRDQTDEERTATLEMVTRTTDLMVTFRPDERLPSGHRQSLYGILEHTLGRALDEKVGRPWDIDTHAMHEWYGINVQLPDGVLHVLSPERRLFSFTSWVFILWMAGSSLLLFTIAIMFMRNQIRPIRRLAIAAEAFGKGRDTPLFKPEGASEVRQAATAFLQMRERIQRQISQRTEMLAGVSHDLRTPLTRMRLQLAMLPEAQEVEELKADVAEMEGMIEAYLAFARGEGAEPPAPTDLGALLSDVVANARREGKLVELTLPELSIVVPLRANDFRRCVANLVGNAVRYAGRAWITLQRQGGHLYVLIDDNGPGIPADMREEVFRPFHRLDGSRNQATGGVGLGLGIARDIANRHGGDILLEDSPQGGLRAVIRLPV